MQQRHIVFRAEGTTTRPPKQPDFEIFVALVSGWAEFPEYIHERETPYVTLPKGEDEIPTAFNCAAGNQDQVADHGSQPTAFDGAFCFRTAFTFQRFLPNDS